MFIYVIYTIINSQYFSIRYCFDTKNPKNYIS